MLSQPLPFFSLYPLRFSNLYVSSDLVVLNSAAASNAPPLFDRDAHASLSSSLTSSSAQPAQASDSVHPDLELPTSTLYSHALIVGLSVTAAFTLAVVIAGTIAVQRRLRIKRALHNSTQAVHELGLEAASNNDQLHDRSGNHTVAAGVHGLGLASLSYAGDGESRIERGASQETLADKKDLEGKKLG